MTNRKHIVWLNQELPSLVDRGILNPAAAERLRAHYSRVGETDPGRALVTLFAVAGGALVGLGIILLLAYNWSGLGRPERTFLAFFPLVCGQALYLFAFLRRKHSTAWREGVSVFLMAALASCLALVGQTYNLGGDLPGLLLTWVILTIPLLYLMPSVSAAVLFSAGLVGWAGAAQVAGGQALLFWPLSLCLAPLLVRSVRENDDSAGPVLVRWTVAILFCSGIGTSLEKVLPGLWIVVYAGYFCLLYCSSKLWFRQDASPFRKPFEFVGAGGTIILAYCLTFAWPWDDIGWSHIREATRFHHSAAILDYAFAILLPLTAGVLSVRLLLRRSGNILLAVFPFLAIAGFTAISLVDASGVGHAGKAVTVLNAVFNLYLLLTGVVLMVRGVRNRAQLVLNAGMAIVSVLILTRFFDEDIGLLFKGVVFIILGAVFLSVNLAISRKRKVRP